jgi:hypothetical protein
MTKKRVHRSPEDKAALLKRHHLDKVPVSALCTESGVQPGEPPGSFRRGSVGRGD